MKRMSATLLALALVAATGAASAQSYYGNDPYYRNADNRSYVQPDRYGNSSGVVYDYARVIRVDPVIASGYGSYPANAGRRCYPADGGYVSNDPYRRDGGRGIRR